MKEADLTNANIRDAFLLNVKGLALDQVKNVSTLYNAKLNESFKKTDQE